MVLPSLRRRQRKNGHAFRSVVSGGRTVGDRTAAVEHQLTSALAQWNDPRDVRFLRRQLLRLLAGLDEA